MALKRFLKSGFLVSIPLMLLLVIAVACGSDATPQPSPTPIDVAALQSALEDAVKAAVPEGISASEVQKMVNDALAAQAATGITQQEVSNIVAAAINEASASQPKPLTEGQIESIVKAAIPTPVPAPVAMMEPRRGGVITMQHFASPPHWDSYAGTFTTFVANNPTHSKVLTYDPSSADPIPIVGDLAQTWEVSDDGKEYIFHLARNARWHDGERLTAADVVFSLDDMVTERESRPQVGAIKAYYESSEAVDDYTVKVKTKFRAAAFMPLFAADFVQIRAKHRVESGVDMKLQESQLGSGPFKVKKYEKDIVIEYERNNDYFKEGLPYVDGIRWVMVLSAPAAFAAYKSGQTNMSSTIAGRMNNASAVQLEKETTDLGTIFWGGPAAGLSIIMNHEKAPFQDKKVREALILAIDRDQLIQTLALGKATLGYPMPPGLYYSLPNEEVAKLPGYRLDASGNKHPDDIAQAKKLLAEAGFPDGRGFKTGIMAHGIADTLEIAQIVADQWRRSLGIEIEVEKADFQVALQRRDAGDFLMYVDTSGVTYLDPDDMFLRRYNSDASHTAWSRWSGAPRIDEIFNMQTSEFDLQTRGDLIREASQVFLDEAPWAVLYWKDLFMFVDNRIQGFNMPTGAYTKNGLYERLWCDPAC